MISLLHGPQAASPFPPACLVPLVGTRVPAGFPSPADDWAEDRVDLNQRYIQHPEATFFFTVGGDSMTGPDPARSIPDGATLIVDRAIEASHDSVVVAVIDGDFTVKRLFNRAGRVALIPENPAYPVIKLGEGQELSVWGVVTAWLLVAK
ncbi:translesion error-prone DNA polymerase V autoproteolytic subunit [Silvimonas sp.]|uniref:LexA family protein n=1 Tax=Silvimonas sp. TaxID=2650811 RepID=UPI002851ABDE|nr:translesion error-prone DNA polymerase V autoproteolytic subunit [Silvimonas sp.]MDR3427915.1 translesion error-prone DNA polymerase V autoproteolytic subunit [Silvimonas sp.]